MILVVSPIRLGTKGYQFDSGVAGLRGFHLIIVYSLLSIITFGVYGFDKLAARRGGERISERTLHLLALCGGWPGALAGQWLFRHKTRKNSFQVCFWLTVLLNGALLLGWRSRL